MLPPRLLAPRSLLPVLVVQACIGTWGILAFFAEQRVDVALIHLAIVIGLLLRSAAWRAIGWAIAWLEAVAAFVAMPFFVSDWTTAAYVLAFLALNVWQAHVLGRRDVIAWFLPPRRIVRCSCFEGVLCEPCRTGISG